MVRVRVPVRVMVSIMVSVIKRVVSRVIVEIILKTKVINMCWHSYWLSLRLVIPAFPHSGEKIKRRK